MSTPSEGNSKRAIVIDSTTHAREWLGTATVLGFIDKVSINGIGQGQDVGQGNMSGFFLKT